MNSETFQSMGTPRSFRILSPYNWNILFPITQGSYHILVLVPVEIAYEMCLISQFLAFKIPFQAAEWYVLVEISQIDSFERYLVETHCDHKEYLFCKRSHNCFTKHALFQSLVFLKFSPSSSFGLQMLSQFTICIVLSFVPFQKKFINNRSISWRSPTSRRNALDQYIE